LNITTIDAVTQEESNDW